MKHTVMILLKSWYKADLYIALAGNPKTPEAILNKLSTEENGFTKFHLFLKFLLVTYNQT